MIQVIRKINFLSVMVITGMLLWGLSFSASSATEPDVIYYAFVMQKHSGKGWELPTKKIGPGSYRFQIVRFESASPNKWVALRGKFDFVKDEDKGGVTIKNKFTLDSIDNAFCDNVQKQRSVWSKKTGSQCTWENARTKWVKPLIDQQKLSKPDGISDPNLIRFLIKNNTVMWNSNDTNYYIHRIHSFLKPNYFVKDKFPVLSRFIKPAQVTPITDIIQIKELINANTDFRFAGYLGQANEEHQKFYKGFSDQVLPFLKSLEAKEWISQANEFLDMAEKEPFKTSQNVTTKQDAITKARIYLDKAKTANIPDLSKDITELEKRLKPHESNFPWRLILLSVLIVIAILLVWIFFLKNDNKNEDDYGMVEDDYEDTEKRQHNPSIFSKIKDSFFGSKPRTPDYNNGESRRDQTQGNQHVRKNQNSDIRGNLENNNIDMNVSPTIANKNPPHVDYVSKEDLRMAVKENLNTVRGEIRQIFDDLITERLNQFSQQPNETLTRQVKAEAEAYMDKFQKALSAKLKNVDDRLDKLAGQRKSTSSAPQDRSFIKNTPTIEKTPQQMSVVSEPRRPPKPKTNDTINQIKVQLVSMRSVDETGLDALDTSVETCAFVTNVVGNCLKLNQPVTHYQRLDSAIQQLTNNKVSLIVSKPNEYIRLEEHNVVGQQAVSKGRTNVVATLIRPGVKCGNDVRRKAEVIQIA